MPTIGREGLKKEREEELDWELNPIKRAIQHIFQHHLSEDQYRKVKPDEAKQIVENQLKEQGVLVESSKSYANANRLLRKIKSKRTTVDVVLELGEYLIG
jgi:hypothetical protein